MEYVLTALKLIIGLSVLNVWLLRSRKATEWRGGDAKNMKEEFAIYGLPEWFMYLVGALKIAFSLGLILSIWYPVFENVSAAGMATLMLGAVSMHIKVKDQVKKALPSFTFLALSTAVVLM